MSYVSMVVPLNSKQKTAAELPNDIEALKSMVLERDTVIAERDTAIAERDALIVAKDHTIAILQRLHFGRKSEKRRNLPPTSDAIGQGHLFHADLIQEAQRAAEERRVQGEIIVHAPKRETKRKGRRKHFPDHLPRVTTHYELEDEACECAKCGGKLHRIGEEATKELERLETTIVHEIRRAKYACRQCTDGVTTAPGADRVIDKGLLGPGFLAHLAVERFGNHMPYNRLEKKYQSEGLDLSRSVLERSMKRIAEILTPIHQQIRRDVLAQPVIFTDDTPVTIARPRGRPRSKQGRVWIYLDRHGRHSYDFTDSREGDRPQKVLAGYCGSIHADAFAGYDALFGPEGAKEVACWAHARRKFDRAQDSEPERAKEALDRIGALYAIEKQAKKAELDDEARLELRQKHSRVLVDELFAWMAKTEAELLPKGPMGMALRYALKLQVALSRFLQDGALEMDNNAAERALRAVAVGRKNWLFFQRETGGETGAVMLSLVMSAKAAGVNPTVYLRDVLLRVAREPDLSKLTPHGWKEHFALQVEAEKKKAMDAYFGR